MKHPMQPLALDEARVMRFQANQLVRALLDFAQAHGMGLNEIAMMDFSNEDRSQLAQLIGYSVSGFHELSYVSDADARAASAAARRVSPESGGCRDDGCPFHTQRRRRKKGETDAP